MSLFTHERHHHVIRNTNDIHDSLLRAGEKIADGVASVMGSWKFIITQSILLALWLIFNTVAVVTHWDPYPFILLNLALSFQAAFATPIILMSQNRTAAKDRISAEEDYNVNRRGEHEIQQMINHLYKQDEVILKIVQEQVKQTALLLSLQQKKR
jgi:uncharacterized membrane protein